MGNNTGKVVGNDPLSLPGVCLGVSANKKRHEANTKLAAFRARRFLIEERVKHLRATGVLK